MGKYRMMVGAVLAVAVLAGVMVVADSGVGAAPPEPLLVAIGSAKIVNISVSQAWLDSDTSILNFSQSPLLLGTVDAETGKVTNGDYLLYLEADLGSAPLQGARLQVRNETGDVIGVDINPTSPKFEGVFPVSSAAFIVGPEGNSVGVFSIRALQDTTAPIGANGVLTIKTALVKSTNPNLAKSPGTSQDVHYFVTSGGNQQHRTVDLIEFGGAK